ncbi:MAG: undecaprenyl/decaprenyl-phosphate alpha-N-acetylglucosaminyl 1-phosphate transferase [Ruminococcaceae bacterium]|nr:undecaprenyl/decaprenyl-phosphate alpha-N-acetylglucosaminyl 1-phosphate transferase [Oscillospiraceae bacterium]
MYYIDTVQFVYLLVGILCAFLLAYTLTPPVRVLAFKIGAIDVPLDDRRMHTKPIPRVGGLAIFLAFTLTTMLFCEFSSTLVTVWIGGAAIVILGMLDDIFRLPAWSKLIVQLLVAAFAVWNGMTIDHINLGGHYVMLGGWSIPVSILWIVGLTNAINFIDGLDGLACGISAISSVSMVLVLLLSGDVTNAFITGILAASCMGFLPFNANPARIFMGDTGALFLGYAMAVMSVQGVFKLHAVLAFLVPVAIFALPLGDTVFAVLRRVCAGKSPFAADRGHLHHRLVDLGFTQRESVKILYAICAMFGLIAVFFTDAMFAEGRFIKTIGIAVLAVIIFVINFIIMKNPRCRRHSGFSDDEMTVAQYRAELEEQKKDKQIRKAETENIGKSHPES